MISAFLERTTAGLLEVFEHSLHAERGAERGGFLQGIDARAKLAGTLALMVSVAAAGSITVVAAVFAASAVAVVVSRVPLRMVAVRTWTQLLALTSLIAVPAVFLTPGRSIGDHATAEGVRVAMILVLRVESVATLAALLVATTSWPEVLRALRSLGVPAVLVVIVAMTYRQLFIVLQRARDMFMASRSRMVGALSGRASRRLAAAAAGALLARSVRTSEEVYLAMQSRGFTGEVRTLAPARLRARDVAAALVCFAVAVAIFLAGRVR